MRIWRTLTVVILGAAIFCWATSGDWIPALDRRLLGPSLRHLAGTDHLGRDVMFRSFAAIGQSAVIALPAWMISTAVGLIIGNYGALYEQRLLGRVVDWLIKVAFATPFLIVLACLAALIGRGSYTVFWVVLLIGWAAPARHARAIARHTLRTPYFVSSVAMGLSRWELYRHVLAPVVARPVVAASGALIAEIMALDMALTIFGLGAAPPQATLGLLLTDGLRFAGLAPWMVVTPIAILGLVAVGLRRQVEQFADYREHSWI